MKNIKLNNKTVNTDYHLSLWEKVCYKGMNIFLLIFLAFIAVSGMITTAVIDPKHFGSEKILYQPDHPLLNILYVLVFVLLAVGLYKFRSTFLKISEKKLITILFIYTMILGVIWVLQVQSAPWADAAEIYNGAVLSKKHDPSLLIGKNRSYTRGYNYFQMHPFQLGQVFLSEIMYTIFGYETALSFEIINVLALALMYVGLQKIAMRLFHSKGVLFILTVFLLFCLQPIFMTAFPYGLIIGFSAAVWAYYFIIRFMQSQHPKRVLLFIPATILMVISILAKYNNMIWLFAMVLVLGMYIIKQKQWFVIVPVLVFSLLSYFSLNCVLMYYENKMDVELESGVSQVLYLDMGMNESRMAPGWYSGLADRLYIQNKGDIKKAEKAAKKNLKKRAKKFFSDGNYTMNFFGQKVISQWNEPSYECIWASQARPHYYGTVEKTSWLSKIYYEIDQKGKKKYNGSWSKKLGVYFNIYQMLMFVLASVTILIFIFRGCRIETLVMVAVLCGGFLYHLLFEAKSQYSLTYFILIVFLASYGLHRLVQFIYGKYETMKIDRVEKKKFWHIEKKLKKMGKNTISDQGAGE